MSEPLLFFGIKPPPEVRLLIDAIRTQLDLDRRYPHEKFHITLRTLGHRRALSPENIAAAIAAAEAVGLPPFRVVFNLVEYGLLLGSEQITGLLRFERSLSAALSRHGKLTRRRSSFRPHITLVHEGAPGRYPIDGISWLVEDFA